MINFLLAALMKFLYFLLVVFIGIVFVFSIVIVTIGFMFLLRTCLIWWYDVDFIKKIEDWLCGRNTLS